MSDLHRSLPAIPACDLLVVAGDLAGAFEEPDAQEAFLAREVEPWLRRAPAREVVMVRGNHDLAGDEALDALPWRVLRDETVRACGLRVHGLEWHAGHDEHPHGPDGDGPDLPPRFACIPAGVDVIVSHAPPLGLRDASPGHAGHGSPWLRRALERTRPRLVLCGHIHRGRGTVLHGPTLVANVSLAGDHDDLPAHPPLVIDLPAATMAWPPPGRSGRPAA